MNIFSRPLNMRLLTHCHDRVTPICSGHCLWVRRLSELLCPKIDTSNYIQVYRFRFSHSLTLQLLVRPFNIVTVHTKAHIILHQNRMNSPCQTNSHHWKFFWSSLIAISPRRLNVNDCHIKIKCHHFSSVFQFVRVMPLIQLMMSHVIFRTFLLNDLFSWNFVYRFFIQIVRRLFSSSFGIIMSYALFCA